MVQNSVRSSGRNLFFVGLAVLLTVVAMIGFAPSFYLQPLFDEPPLTLLLFVHGVFATSWFAMLISQAVLARTGRIALHRRIGGWGFVIGLLFALSALAIIVTTATDGKQTTSGLPESTGLFIQLGSFTWFSVLATLAYRKRALPDFHKRLIAVATITMMAPVFARISRMFRDGGPPPFDSAFFAIPFIIALVWHDFRKLGRLHPVTLWAGFGYILFITVRMPIARSEVWNNQIVPAILGS